MCRNFTSAARPVVAHGVRALMLGLLFTILAASRAWAVDPAQRISQYAHTAWRLQDGVFNGVPHAIAQTVDGYLWIGTDAGLVRFDGVRFLPWVPQDSQLPSPNVYSLLAARDGSLWIGTGRGLARLTNSRLQTFPDIAGRINALLEDPDGTIWVVRSRQGRVGGALCQGDGNGVRCYDEADGVACRNAGALARDRRGNLWFGGSDGLCRWKPGDSATFLRRELEQVKGLAGIHAIAAGQDGDLWVGIPRAGRGLGLQHFIDGAWTSVAGGSLDGKQMEVTALLIDRDNALWIGTMKEGIYRVYHDRVDHFSAAEGLSSNSIDNFLQDREGNLWVATSKGIDRLRDFRVTTFSTREGLTADRVNSVVAARDGTVWIGNQGALERLRDGNASSITDRDGLPGKNVTSLFEDRAGRLWVGVDDGLAVYEGGRFRSLRRRDGGSIGIVSAIAEDAEHSIWVLREGRPRGLIRIQGFEVREELFEPQFPSVYALAADPGGGLWLGLNDGLARYRHGQLEKFVIDGGLDTASVRNLIVDADGSVWGATRQQGVVRWKDGRFRLLGVGNGLPCDRTFSLVRDSGRALWVYAACGLVMIPDSELVRWWSDSAALVTLRTLDMLDGLQPGASTFYPQASRSPDGRLWFANDSVLQSVDPGVRERVTTPPPVHVEQVIADRQGYAAQERLLLPALTRDIEVDYTATSFAIPERVRFRHKLEGYDREWHEAQKDRRAYYSNLPPGTYAFRVIASDHDGVWNPRGARLTLVVPPAWFQTSPFRASCVLAVVLLAWAIYRMRLRKLATEMSARFDERLAERTRIARELHDTLLQTIQASKLVADHARERADDRGHTRQAVTQLCSWLGQAVQEGRAALHSLRTAITDDNDLADAFRRVATNGAVSPGLAVAISVVGDAKETHPVVRDEIFRIGCEAIRNARAHAMASRLTVEVRFDEDLTVRVKDDGVGMDPSVAERGKDEHFGIPGMRERAVRVGARLTVVPALPSGTEVTLIVPGRIAFRRTYFRDDRRSVRNVIE